MDKTMCGPAYAAPPTPKLMNPPGDEQLKSNNILCNINVQLALDVTPPSGIAISPRTSEPMEDDSHLSF